MFAEFTTSIAGPGFAYEEGQVVSPGEGYGPRAVPKDQFEAWRGSGILKVIDEPETIERAVAKNRR